MSSADSSDGGSEWDSSDLDSVLTRPKGSPDIRHGLFFEDVEEFWEKHSPKVKKINKNNGIADTLKKLSKIEEKHENKRKDENIPIVSNSNQISPIFPRHRVEKPQYNPDISESPQGSKQPQKNFQSDQNDIVLDIVPNLPSTSESSDEEPEIPVKTQKYKRKPRYEASNTESTDSMEPEELEEEQIIIRTPSSPKMILPPVAHLPSPKIDKKPIEKKENPTEKNENKISKHKKNKEIDENNQKEDKKKETTQKENDEEKPKKRKKKDDPEKEKEKEIEKGKKKELEKKRKKETKEKHALSQTLMKKQKAESSPMSSSQVIRSSQKITAKVKDTTVKTPRSTAKKPRKYNFDNYLDDDSDDQPVVILPEKPQEPAEDGPIALRRSQRVRVKPLKHWAGEYIQYNVGKDNLRSFSHIVRNTVDSLRKQSQKDSENENDNESNKTKNKQSKYDLTPLPYHQYEIMVDPEEDYSFPVQKFTRHVVHLDGIGRLYLSRHTYNLEDFADFIIPAGQEATISSKCNTKLRLLVIDYT